MAQELSDLVEHYSKFYPDYSLESLVQTIRELRNQLGKVDATTLDYFMRSIDRGGLGYGMRKQTYRGDQNSTY